MQRIPRWFRAMSLLTLAHGATIQVEREATLTVVYGLGNAIRFDYFSFSTETLVAIG